MSNRWRMFRTGWTLLHKPLVVNTPPLHFQLEPVIGCNLACHMCQVPDYPPERCMRMTLAQFRGIFDQIRPIRVALSGAGEPFLNPELLDIVRYARAGGASVLTTSNFTLVQKKIEEIVASGLNLIKISLDSARPETYQKIRGKDFFDLIVRNIEELQRVKREKRSDTPYVRLQFVLQADNLDEAPGLIELAHRLGVDSAYFQPLETLLIQDRKGRLAGGVSMERMRDVLQKVAARAKELNIGTNAPVLLRSLPFYFRKYQPGIPPNPPSRICLLPWFSLYIAVTGDVRPCCSFAEPGTSMGNVLEQPFREIWNGEPYQELRRASRDRRLCYAVCRNCIPNRLRDFVSLSAVLPGFFGKGHPGRDISE